MCQCWNSQLSFLLWQQLVWFKLYLKQFWHSSSKSSPSPLFSLYCPALISLLWLPCPPQWFAHYMGGCRDAGMICWECSFFPLVGLSHFSFLIGVTAVPRKNSATAREGANTHRPRGELFCLLAAPSFSCP